MKEFVEKLIGRLEEKKSEHLYDEKVTQGLGRINLASFCSAKAMALDGAISIVNQLAEEMGISKMEDTTWIPCSERLPERNKDVLCWAESTARGGDVCFVGSCDNGFWFLPTAIGTLSFPTQYDVIAWMPLPESFKPSAE